MRIKLMLLAIGLGVGGTETHILELASGIDRSKFDVTVCSLKPGGCVIDELRRRGIRVVCLNGAGKFDLRVLFRLWRLVREERPDVMQSFLFWANVSARVLGRVSKAVRVVCSYHDEIVSEGRLMRMIDRLTFRWSHAVVCCSEAVRRSVVVRLGAPAAGQTIIPFGVDTEPLKLEHAGQLQPAFAANFVAANMFDGIPLDADTVFSLMLLMPGRLLEVDSASASRLREWLRGHFQHLLVYAYGDWLLRDSRGLAGLVSSAFGDRLELGTLERGDGVEAAPARVRR